MKIFNTKGVNMNVPTWDDYFMSMAYLVAMRSKDMSTHVGSIIVGPDKEIRSTGYNGLPRFVNDDIPERQERPEKYYWFEHAERNAIYNAALIGVSLRDCTIYTNGIPCMDCARAIVQAGLIAVITDKQWDETNIEKWAEHAKRTLQMFNEVGISFTQWTGNIVEITKQKNSEIILKV